MNALTIILLAAVFPATVALLGACQLAALWWVNRRRDYQGRSERSKQGKRWEDSL